MGIISMPDAEGAGARHDFGAVSPAAGDPLRDDRRAGAVHRPRWRNYTAFVLPGSGARGALQVGALRALLEAGERPDVVVGVSIGAWNGAWLASNPTLEGVQALDEVWRAVQDYPFFLGPHPLALRSPKRVRVVMSVAQGAWRLATNGPSLYGNAGMRHLLDAYLGATTFEELPIPLRIVATDITRCTRAVFSSGSVAAAVLASSAIPVLFPPVPIGSSLYVDGGLLDNASIESAVELGARRIFVLNGGAESDESQRAWLAETTEERLRVSGASRHTISAVVQRILHAMSQYHISRAISQLPPGVEVHHVRLGGSARGHSLAFRQATDWIEQGYAEANAYLRSRSTAHAAPEPALIGG